MSIHTRPFTVLIAGALVSALSEAGGALAQDASTPLDTIRVIAPHGITQEVIPEAKRQTLPYASSGVSREQFEDLPNQRLGDVLQDLPGITLGGAPGEKKDVRLRGLDKEFTRVQFDGVQLTDGGEKREFQVSRFPSYLLGDVTIIRNPTAEFEADGIAGRIALEFRDIPLEKTLEIQTGAGGGSDLSFGDDREFQAAYGERFGKFGVQLGFSHNRDPISKRKRKDEIGGKLEVEDEIKTPTYNDAFADFAWFGQRHEIHIKPLLLGQEEEKDKTKTKFKASGALDKTELEVEKETNRTLGVIVDHTFTPTADLTIETKFAFSKFTKDKKKEKTFFKADGSLDKSEKEQEDKQDETFEFGTKVTKKFVAVLPNELKFGGTIRVRDRFRDKTKLEIKGGNAKDKTSPKDTYVLDENYFAVFVQDTIGLSEKLSITPGVRIEQVIQEPTSGAGVTGSKTITDVLPSLHLLYRPNGRVALRAAVSRQVNRPKFDELAPFQEEKGSEIVEGNPDLDPARSWSYDVGGDYATRNLFFGVNLFHREITDVIESVDTGIDIGGKDLLRSENAGDGFVQGIELEQRLNLAMLDVDALKNFSVRANQTFIHSELTDQSGFKRPFKNQPGAIANVSLVYENPVSGITLSLSGNYVSDITKDEAQKKETVEEEFFLKFFAEKRIYKNVSLFGWVENITGEERRKIKVEGGKTTIEDEDTGRAFFLGIKMKL